MVNAPYLIQRAVIRTPLAPPTERLSDSVRFDYMGSSEFEYGTMPQSLRRIEAKQEQLTICKVDDILDGESPLRVLSYFDDDQFKEYVQHLRELRNSASYRYPLKERSEFPLSERKPPEPPLLTPRNKRRPVYHREQTNFWWDISNDMMFSFHKEYMNRLLDHLFASFAYMNAKKAAS